MIEYLHGKKGLYRLDAQWKVIGLMDYEASDMLFYVDTEFTADYLLEIAIINAAGEEVIDTLVRHEKIWKEIHDEASPQARFWLETQKSKFQFDDDWNFPPSATAMDAAEVATRLQAASCSSPNARFVEYSRGNFDTKKIRDFLEVGGKLGHILGEHRGYGALALWQKILPGFWDFSQETIFVFNHPGHPLAKVSHRALVDAQKLRILMKDLFHDSAA